MINPSDTLTEEVLAQAAMCLVRARTKAPLALLPTESERTALARYLARARLSGLEKELLKDLWTRQEQLGAWLLVELPGGRIRTYTLVCPETRVDHLREVTGAPALKEVSAGPDDLRSGTWRGSSHKLDLHRGFVLNVAQRAEAEEHETHHEGSRQRGDDQTLGGVLLSVVEAAGLARFGAERRSGPDDAARLLEELCKYELTAGVPVRSWCRCPLLASQLPALHQELLAARPGWPAVSRPYALGVVLATALSPEIVVAAGRGAAWRVPVAGHLAAFAPRDTGPWLVLVTIGENALARNTCACLRAYAHPVLSRDCWLLVDSRFERRVAHLLMEFVAAFCRRTGHTVSVQKPVNDLSLGSGRAVARIRPDFVLTLQGYDQPLYLEVLGSVDPRYRATKAEHAAVLRRHGAYHEFDANRAEAAQGAWAVEEELLLQAVCEWISCARSAKEPVQIW